MQLLPLSLCLLTLTGSTFSDGNGPVSIIVKEGDDVILPCKINQNIWSNRFDWMKDGTKMVYLYEGGPLLVDDDQFSGRVSHFDRELRNGNASITVFNTEVSDTGFYTCDFPNLHQTFTVRLAVGKAAKVFILKPEQTEDGFLLQCLVSDVSPGFKLNISWFDGSGNKLIEQISNTESEKPDILQTTVKKSDTYRCVATMEELSHQVHSEVHVQIPESNIPLIVGLVGLAVIASIIVAAAGVMYKIKRPVIITVTEGDAVTLPCNIKINNILFKRFKWKKDGKEVDFLNEDGLLPSQEQVYLNDVGPLSGQDDQFKGRVSLVKNGDASITIIDTKLSDSGVYTCHFPNLHQTFTVRLVVEPLFIKVTEGDEATLPCDIKENIESQRFEWMKHGRKVYLYEDEPLYDDQDDQFRGRVLNRGHSYLMNGVASITIYDTKLSDSGDYTCHFPKRHQTFTVRLRVEKRKGRPKGQLIITAEGRYVTLPCKINKNIESEQFGWKKDGKKAVCLYEGGQLSGDQDDQFKGRVFHFKYQLKNGNASITIHGTKVSDTGFYTCDFPNLEPKQTFTVRLLVESLIIKVSEGDAVTLPCNIQNKNIVSERFEWKKDGRNVYLYDCEPLYDDQDDQFRGRVSHFIHELKHGDASITIFDTKPSDSGVYTCHFPNLHQTFTVRLRVASVIVRVTEGDEATLPCNINKNIESERFEWMKHGKNVYLYEGGQLSGQDEEFRGRVSHFIHDLNNGDASITISDTNVSDSGFYTCDFPNLQPKQTFTVRLLVEKRRERGPEGMLHVYDNFRLEEECGDSFIRS